MTDQQTQDKHTLVQSIFLHLFPGILIGAFYFLVRNPVQKFGYPTLLALTLAITFVLIPVELGYLLIKGKQRTGHYTLTGVISYRVSIPWWQYVVWVLIVFVMMGVVFTVFKPFDDVIREKFYFWIPSLESGLDGSYSRTALIITYTTLLVVGVVVGPLVEELYFRGYLLARIPSNNAVIAALMHSFLFGLYHVWTPWMFLTRTVAMLPLIYAVKKKNIYIGIITHIMINTIDVIAGFAFIAGMT